MKTQTLLQFLRRSFMTTSELIQPQHLSRQAIVCTRQSSRRIRSSSA
jgi:hypothetical protein